MDDFGNDINKNIDDSKSADPPKKIDLNQISSSINEASSSLDQKQKELDDLAGQRNKILEKINQKIQNIKNFTEAALSKTSNGLFEEAISDWNKVLEFDPENEDAKNNILSCQAKIQEKIIAPPEIVPPANEVPVQEQVSEPQNTMMSQSELDSMLGNMSSVTSDSATAPTSVNDEKAPQELLSQSQLDVLLGVTPAQAANPADSENSAGEILSQDELDKLLGNTPAINPPSESPSDNFSKIEETGAPSVDLSLEEIKTTDQDLAALTKGMEGLEQLNDQKDIVIEEKNVPVADSTEIHEVPASSISDFPKNEDMETVLKEMGKADELDLADVEKLGETVAAKVSGEIEASKVSIEQISAGQAAKEYQATQVLSDIPMHTTPAPASSPVPAATVKIIPSNPIWIILTFVLGIGFLISTFFALPNHDKPKEVPVEIKPLTFDQKTNDLILKGKEYINKNQMEEAWKILFSISDEFPSTGTIISTLYQAADIYYEALQKMDAPENADYINSAKLYEKIADQFSGNIKTERACFNAAECYYRAEIFNKAYDLYLHIVQDFPESENYQKSLIRCGKLLMIQNKFKDARDTYLKIIHEFPDSAAAKLSQLDIAKTYKLEALKIKAQFNIKELD